MLFGTYENPKDWIYSCGFDDDKEQRLTDMLVYKGRPPIVNVDRPEPSAAV